MYCSSGVLVIVFKIWEGSPPTSDVMVHSCLYTECDCLRLEKSCVQYDLRKFCLSNIVVYTWNSLPNWVVSADTTNTFKARLDKFWHSQDIIYNFRSRLQGTRSHIDRVFVWRILARNYVVEWLDEAGIEASASTRKFSLCLRLCVNMNLSVLHLVIFQRVISFAFSNFSESFKQV